MKTMTDIEKISDEKIMGLFINRLNTGDLVEADEFETELLSRLARGRRAIEAMEKMQELVLSGVPLMWAKGEYVLEASEWEKRFVSILRKYQEATDEHK